MSSTPAGPPLSPPIAALVASIEAARMTMNAQLDAVLAQINAMAYTSAAIANAQRQRHASQESSAMPATFGARPSSHPTQSSPSHSPQPPSEEHDGQSARDVNDPAHFLAARDRDDEEGSAFERAREKI